MRSSRRLHNRHHVMWRVPWPQPQPVGHSTVHSHQKGRVDKTNMINHTANRPPNHPQPFSSDKNKLPVIVVVALHDAHIHAVIQTLHIARSLTRALVLQPQSCTSASAAASRRKCEKHGTCHQEQFQYLLACLYSTAFDARVRLPVPPTTNTTPSSCSPFIPRHISIL